MCRSPTRPTILAVQYFMMKVWVNNKNCQLYLELNTVLNATNAQDGQKMIYYRAWNKPFGAYYVREFGEFSQKFRVATWMDILRGRGLNSTN